MATCFKKRIILETLMNTTFQGLIKARGEGHPDNKSLYCSEWRLLRKEALNVVGVGHPDNKSP